MEALTVKQPWAQAIAQFGKNVENRSKRPPGHLIGQRIAIHVGKTWPNDGELWSAMEGVKQHCPDLFEWNYQHRELRFQRLPSPNAGRIIATARLVGWNRYGHDHSREAIAARVKRNEPCCYNGVIDATSYRDAPNSPWFTGPVAWVLADVVMLLEPVGQECPQCTGHGSLGHLNLPASYPVLCDMCNGVGTEPIRGKLGCWPVPHAIAAQVHEQEQMARGRR